MNLHMIKTAMLAAAPQQAPQLGVNGTGVGIGVIVIIVCAGSGWYLIKHKGAKGKHAAVFFILGLAMTGTQIGGMFQQMTGTLAQTIAQFVSSA